MDCNRILRSIVATLATGLALAAVSASASVPNPTVLGPIPQNASPGDPSHDYTFFSSQNLAANGYVEEEYFIEGTANVYATPPLATGTLISSGHPYKSRIVVRRPADSKRFNGTVILEWLNVTGGFDLDGIWLSGSAADLMRKGYAWVGVSAQRVGIHQPGTGLRAWSPVRYGTLDVTDGGVLLADELCYDIFSQAGQAVMSPAGIDPLRGARPHQIIAGGISQSAARLGIYYNSIQPLAGLCDGFMVLLANPFVRGDLSPPVFKVHSESDAAVVAAGVNAFGLPVPPLQPDTDHCRTWQVAGASHIDRYFTDNLYPLAGRDGILLPPPGLCATPEWSRVHLYYVLNAAFNHMVRWASGGAPPPSAPPIGTDGTVIARDATGLALGGIRLADVDVPIALNTGENSGPFFCPLLGTHIPFDGPTLASLYPDHGTYVDAVQAVVDANLAAGYIVQRDGKATITEAAMSSIGYMSLALSPSRRTARLEQNRPNPFNPHTEIRYSLSERGRVRLDVYDVHGRAIRRLVDREQSAGEHRATWAGTDDRGRPVASGVYLYRLSTNGYQETRKLVVDR